MVCLICTLFTWPRSAEGTFWTGHFRVLVVTHRSAGVSRHRHSRRRIGGERGSSQQTGDAQSKNHTHEAFLFHHTGFVPPLDPIGRSGWAGAPRLPGVVEPAASFFAAHHAISANAPGRGKSYLVAWSNAPYLIQDIGGWQMLVGQSEKSARSR
jgi:hypothetical protein